MSQSQILGQSRVGPKYRITLVREVVKKLGISEGDTTLFILNEKGEVTIKVVSQKELLRMVK